jgi:hypothetical protein
LAAKQGNRISLVMLTKVSIHLAQRWYCLLPLPLARQKAAISIVA